jgi:hypothetical protein
MVNDSLSPLPVRYYTTIWGVGGGAPDGLGAIKNLADFFTIPKLFRKKLTHWQANNLRTSVQHFNLHFMKEDSNELIYNKKKLSSDMSKCGFQRYTEITHDPLLFSVAQGIF